MFGTLLGDIFQIPQNLRTQRSPATISEVKINHCASLFAPFSEHVLSSSQQLSSEAALTVAAMHLACICHT